MRLLTILAAALPLAAAPPGAPPGFIHWKASELKAFSQKLAPKMDAHKLATERLDKFPNHLFMVAHREASGEAELHETQADVFVIESGAASFVVGGEVVGGKTTAAGEIRGPSIKGGETVKLGAGDIVHIPAKVPHQMMLAPGQHITYFMVKVDTP